MATAVKVRPDKIKGSGGLVSSCTAAGAKGKQFHSGNNEPYGLYRW